MSAVATPSVHALLRDLVANSPRRHFLHDTEGVELSNQGALLREFVATVQACLERDLNALRESERKERSTDPDWADGPGIRLIASIAQYDEILNTLLDAVAPFEAGRMTTVWTLLGSAAERLRILAALESSVGERVAAQLAAASARARGRLTAAASENIDLDLPAALVSAELVATETDPLPLPGPHAPVAALVELVELGAATARDGGPLDVQSLHASPHATDYVHLATVGGYQFHLVLEIVREATDALCSVADLLTHESVWSEWATDVRAAVEYAWACI
ncbi:hypothetical protein DEU38_11678 [Rhodococcus sp. AG1013]|uniref:hypothetical protein n=1 Tax=Rhodococcus sp. AG1013 TaxID=2183996 RepID=UPI000E0A149E|nr:hypothetical protein [Rhodococcus sp. AG1013]RDI20529.1 hypothetical protein DEU38_11678 [Rhodococcus sp. AG1013]